jgi:hypothetical protein
MDARNFWAVLPRDFDNPLPMCRSFNPLAIREFLGLASFGCISRLRYWKRSWDDSWVVRIVGI